MPILNPEYSEARALMATPQENASKVGTRLTSGAVVVLAEPLLNVKSRVHTLLGGNLAADIPLATLP